MSRLEEVQYIIEKYELKQKSRYMHMLYRRYYLYKVLKRDGMTLSQIGRLFNQTHATVINGIAKHDTYMKYKDPSYMLHTRDLREKFVLPQYYKPLKQRVLECVSMEKLEKLKEQIRCNYY
jgi:hypothetical protein